MEHIILIFSNWKRLFSASSRNELFLEHYLYNFLEFLAVTLECLLVNWSWVSEWCVDMFTRRPVHLSIHNENSPELLNPLNVESSEKLQICILNFLQKCRSRLCSVTELNDFGLMFRDFHQPYPIVEYFCLF